MNNEFQDNGLVSSFCQENMDASRKECPEVAISATESDDLQRILALSVDGKNTENPDRLPALLNVRVGLMNYS